MESKCPDCNGIFQSVPELCAHFNDCHRSKTSSSNVKSKHQCNICDYESDRSSNVARHRHIIHGVKTTQNFNNSDSSSENMFTNNGNARFNNNKGNRAVVISSNEQFGMNKGCDKKYDIRLKENFKLFVSGPSRCGKTFFVSDIIENIRGFAK